MALFLCKNADGSGIINDTNTLQTKHTNQGEPQTLKVYLSNDGKRTGVENDTSGMALIYTNISILIEGYSHTLTSALAPSTSATTLNLDSTDGWGIGTILKSSTERMRVEEIISDTSVRVTRNYTADGGVSNIGTHIVGTSIIPDTATISLAPVSVDDTTQPGNFNNGGETMTIFLAPTYLTNVLTSAESATTVQSGDGTQYAANDIIQIDNEQMCILAVSGNTLTVSRGYNNTQRSNHQARSVIYLVGMSQVGKTYPFFIKNDPPSGLPTQKKYDIKIKISTDEEPL